jgi:hypothetical protein
MVKAMPLERRRKAALFRRVANIPTSGGRLADRALLRLADQLDYEASCLEQQGSLSALTLSAERDQSLTPLTTRGS